MDWYVSNEVVEVGSLQPEPKAQLERRAAIDPELVSSRFSTRALLSSATKPNHGLLVVNPYGKLMPAGVCEGGSS